MPLTTVQVAQHARTGALGLCWLGAAAVSGLVAVHYGTLFALVVAAVPAVLLLLRRPAVAAGLALAALPLLQPLVDAAQLLVSASDILLVVAVVGLVLPLLMGADRTQGLQALRPVLLPLVVYFVGLLVVLLLHPFPSSAATLAQRVELVFVPLLAGALLLRGALLRYAVLGYLAVCLGLTTTLVLVGDDGGVLGLQKNPLGQALVGGVLLAVACPRLVLPVRLVALPLVGGLLLTQSRGAIIGLLAGLVVLVLLQTRRRSRLVLLLVPLAFGSVLLFRALPDDVQARNSTFSADVAGAAGYTIDIRQRYVEDAVALIREHPVTGVGLDQYIAGRRALGTQTDDPHNVFLLDTAEGGFPLGVALVLLLGGSVVVCARRRSLSEWSGPGAAVQTAIIVHGLFDIYWVRGTPVLGWLLVGVALSASHPPVPDRA